MPHLLPNMLRRLALFALAILPLAARAEPPTGAQIAESLRDFASMGTVLHVAAHPDDENTALIAYLAKARHYRAAYLSVTRGDGGQNLIGPEFSEQLGVIRTQELLVARKLDGGRQFFTRAIDFGFSKDVNETLKNWDRDRLVADIVRVIRSFRPDVIVTRFSTQAGGTHGHHTASAVLALEAFKVSGDANAYPEQIAEGLKPWQPKRIFVNGGGGRGGGGPRAGGVSMQAGGTDPITGEDLRALSGRSRAMHKSQGVGNRGGGGAWTEGFSLLDGEPATQDIMDGVDTTWGRVEGGAEIAKRIESAIAAFDPQKPEGSVPALLEIKKLVAAVPKDPVVAEKQLALDQVIADCAGIAVEAIAPRPTVAPGESIAIKHSAAIATGLAAALTNIRPVNLQVQTGEWTAPFSKAAAIERSEELAGGFTATLPLTQPYWLREDPVKGMYRVNQAELIGLPQQPSPFEFEYSVQLNGPENELRLRAVAASVQDGVRRDLAVIAPVALDFSSETRLFAPGETKQVEVEATAHRPGIKGDISLEAPAGWKIEPAAQPFEIAADGAKAKASFAVTAPANAAAAVIGVHAQVAGRTYASRRIDIVYPHIPPQILQPPARIHAVALDLKNNARRVAYVPGAGDSVAQAIAEMGCEVTETTGADLTADKLKGFDAVVFGVRAFDVRDDLAAAMPAVLEFVNGGGVAIIQYNRQSNANLAGLGDLAVRPTNTRVTDENAAVTFLAPDHPALNAPNKIAQADFDGWVQERGIYYPTEWPAAYVPILAAGDPGEQPLNGGLLVAKHGKGSIVYTGLVFFRELPAGVPGAYRLMANLISLGKQ